MGGKKDTSHSMSSWHVVVGGDEPQVAAARSIRMTLVVKRMTEDFPSSTQKESF